ncbi:MAG: carboxypeptidase regulatory-like domain-containing protein [Planctomycetes bacterium]|nr:carboxypeptidase regulatory-like domain-containing protein [Planctomycetota bacterium]
MRVWHLILVVALVAITVVLLVLPRSEPPETPAHARSSPTKTAAATEATKHEPEPPRTDVALRPEPAASARVAAAPATAAPVQEPKGGVWGVVNTEAGAPIEGATLRLKTLRVFGIGGKTDVDREVVSGSDGRFRFADLPDEKDALFSVTASHPSYYALRVTTKGNSACTLTLGPPGVVRGRVVYEGTDEPCAGAIVQLSNMRGGSGHAETDENGDYRIAALRPGAYHATIGSGRRMLAHENVRVEANSETEANFRVKRSVAVHGIVRDAGSEAPVQGAVIRSQLGRESIEVGPDGCFTLPDVGHGRYHVTAPGYVAAAMLLRDVAETSPERPHVVRLERGAVIEGVLQKEDGGLLPENVRVIADKEGERRHMLARPDRVAEVARDGRFRIEGVPAGVPVRVIAVEVMRQLAESEPLTLYAGETRRDVRLTLPATGSIAGRVTGPDGQPVAGARVSVRPSGDTLPVPVARQTTGADGRYTLERVPPGRHTIHVSANEFAHATRDCTLEKPEPLNGVDFQLSSGLSIGGVVRDTNGHPVARVSVSASPASGAISAIGHATTDENGQFLVKNLAAGTYRISCFSPDYGPPMSGDRTVFAAAGTADVALVLEALSGAVTGVVSDRATGVPVPRFSVWIIKDGGSFQQKFSDRDGRFRLAGRPAGRQSLLATSEDGRVSEIATVELTPGGTPAPVELWLVPGTSIQGRVLAPDGSPVERAGVEVVRTSSPRGTVGRAATDRDGWFRCIGLRQERVIVRASHPEWVEVEKEVTPGNALPEVELRLAADGATVTVTVVDGAGKPVASVPVQFSRDGRLMQPDYFKDKPPPGTDPRGANQRLLQTDENGRHVRRFLPRGRYTIEVDVSEGRGSVAVDVEIGATTAVTLRLAPRG